jgi:hypothetical protein
MQRIRMGRMVVASGGGSLPAGNSEPILADDAISEQID